MQQPCLSSLGLLYSPVYTCSTCLSQPRFTRPAHAEGSHDDRQAADGKALALLLGLKITPIHVSISDADGICRTTHQTLLLSTLMGSGVGHGIIDSFGLTPKAYVHSFWQATAEDRRVTWAYNDGLRLAPLPVLAAASEHTYFVQHLHERCLSVVLVGVSATHLQTTANNGRRPSIATCRAYVTLVGCESVSCHWGCVRI